MVSISIRRLWRSRLRPFERLRAYRICLASSDALDRRPSWASTQGRRALDDRRREFLSDLKPVLRWMAAHHGLYPGQRRDASEYLLAHGRRRAALELHKPSPPVDPTVCEIPWVGDPSRIAERVVHCVAIDMQRVAAGIVAHQFQGDLGAAIARVVELHDRRVGTAMAALIAGDRPQIVRDGSARSPAPAPVPWPRP